MDTPIYRSVLACILVVLLSALALPAVFVALARLGFPFGTGVVALSEDYNWLLILSAQGVAKKAQAFWAMNDRNPLSPWWYIAAEKLYTGRVNGPYLTRLLMQPLMGLSAFAMIYAVTAGRSTGLALAVAILAAGGIFAGSIDQVHWNFLGALSLSMLCVATYAAWLNSGRTQVAWYGVSLILWYFAFATYSFQVGAILAIALLTLMSPRVPNAGLVRRLVGGALEVAPYALLLGGFLLTWKTAQNPVMAGYYSLQPSLLFKNLPTSLLIGMSPGRYWGLAQTGSAQLPTVLPIICAALGLGAAALHWSVQSVAAPRWRDALLVLAVAFCLVLPTTLIESMSATWSVGTRWPMVDQAWQPLFWLSLAAAVIGVIPLSQLAQRSALSAAVGVAVALSVAPSLGYNYLQIKYAGSQLALRSGMESAAAAIPEGQAFNFIVLIKPDVALVTPDVLSARIAQVWFPRRDAGLRILRQEGPASEFGQAPWWRVGFEDDRADNVRIEGGSSDYSALHVFQFDGRSVIPLTRLSQSDVAGYPVDWRRSGDLTLPPAPR